MKINIPKLQEGGSMGSPFVSWASVSTLVDPTSQPASPNDPIGQQGGGVEDLLSKDMIKSLLEHGLPNDVNAFIGAIQDLYNDPTYRISGQINPSALSSRYLNLIGKINTIRYSKDSYDNTISELTANGGLNDVAITATGRMLVINEEGQVEQITPEEFSANYGEYRALTNSELAHMRANNPNLAFNSDVFNVLQTGVGSKRIQEYLNAAIQNLGNTSSKSETFISRKDGKILDGLRTIEENPSIQQSLLSNGIYKVSSDESSNLEQGKLALSYIYDTLPENAKTYLRAKAAINGLDPSTGVQSILTQFITSKGKVSSSYGIGYESALSKASGFSEDGTKTGGKEGTDKVSQQKLFQENLTDDVRTFTLNPGINFQGVTKALHWNTILSSKDNLPIDIGSVNDLFTTSSLGLVGDRNSVYFGKQKLTPAEARQLGVDVSQGVDKITLPSIIDPETGGIAPDLDALTNIEKAESRIAQAPNIPELEKRQIYENYGVGDYYGILKDPDLLSKTGRAHNFYVVSGIGSSRNGAVRPKENRYVDPTGEDTNNVTDYLAKLSGDERDSWTELLENQLNAGMKKGDNKVVVSGGIFNLRGDLYKGNIFIAESKDHLTPLVASGVLSEPKSDNTLQEQYNRGLATNRPLRSLLD